MKYYSRYIGVILLGEAFEWKTDPPEMKKEPFYRLMGFIIDKNYRGKGIGGFVLEKVIRLCYEEFGIRPIALGCHKDNYFAERFYLAHGFEKTGYMEGNDFYFLRHI
ncbi:MAG: GNAT family N-acetyltransferase [Oscillospiraceae bacterium]|nr:GNAT family N-acetyltransferase [Oscillospiraceae bacterium]